MRILSQKKKKKMPIRPLFHRKPLEVKVESGVRLAEIHYPIEHESRRKCCNCAYKIERKVKEQTH